MAVAGIPLDFILFALTLLGVAVFHHRTLEVALVGVTVIALAKLAWGDFAGVPGFAGLARLLAHEWVTLANLLALLLGFALLADHFGRSHLTQVLPRWLPDDWKGGFCLLAIIFVLSSFLDNIAAAMIGGAMAAVLYRNKVHVGYLAAIVAASNAGGAGSVVGDTTTTMMWIAGVEARQVFDAYVGSIVALAFFGVVAARQQHRLQPIEKDNPPGVRIDFAHLGVVAFMLLAAMATNLWCNLYAPQLLEQWPMIGIAVWVALLLSIPVRAPQWSLLPGALRGTVFLLALVLCAAMMPVQKLPTASAGTTLGLGFVSAFFDNIPLTALALRQGGYDWGFLAFAVGFGGSMLWFGSSAGVALCNLYPEARSVGAWLRSGWHVAVGYVLGYAALLLVIGWEPDGHLHRGPPVPPPPQIAPAPAPRTP